MCVVISLEIHFCVILSLKSRSHQNLGYVLLFQEIVSEVLEEKLGKEVPQKEDGTAPKYITPLQKVYPSRDGELIR